MRLTAGEAARWLTGVLARPGRIEFRAGDSGPGPGWGRIATYGWLGLRDGRGLLLPLASRGAAGGSLRLYRPQRVKARAAKGLLALGLKAGVAGRFLPKVHVWLRGGVFRQETGSMFLPHHIGRIFGRHDLTFGLTTGTAGPLRKPVLIVMTRRGAPLGYAKIGWNEQTRRSVENEHNALEALGGRHFAHGMLPRVKHFGAFGETLLLITEPLPLRDWRRSRLSRRHVAFLMELAAAGAVRTTFLDSGFLGGLLARVEQIGPYLPPGQLRMLEEAVDLLKAELGSLDIPWVWRLGDFLPWNTGAQRRGRRVIVIDLEYASAESVPGWDLFHSLTRPYASRGRRAEVSAVVDLAWRPPLRAYFEALGIGASLIPLLYLCYLVDQFTLWVQMWSRVEGDLPPAAAAAMSGYAALLRDAGQMGRLAGRERIGEGVEGP